MFVYLTKLSDMLHAVITGDIVNSTLITPAQERELVNTLGELLAGHKHEFFRGDSFQVYARNPAEALKIALLCRTAAIRLIAEDAPVTSDVRVSIGIGPVISPVKSLATAKGEAFLLSGRALDELEKSRGRLIIRCENKLAGVAYEVLSDYLNSICRQMTQKQAEVIYELLHGVTQQQVAEKLNRSKSTISQHVASGRWEELEKILNDYQKILQLISI